MAITYDEFRNRAAEVMFSSWAPGMTTESAQTAVAKAMWEFLDRYIDQRQRSDDTIILIDGLPHRINGYSSNALDSAIFLDMRPLAVNFSVTVTDD